MSTGCIVSNACLFATAAYSMYQITPKYPYAFFACAFVSMHSLLGLVECINGGHCEPNEIHAISNAISEIMPLPLINIELHRQSGNYFAMGHAFFVVPLVFDLMAKIYEEGEDRSTAMLKDLTILGNITSLTYLGINTERTTCLLISLAAICSRFGSLIMERYSNIDARNCGRFFDAAFFALVGVEIVSAASAQPEKPNLRVFNLSTPIRGNTPMEREKKLKV